MNCLGQSSQESQHYRHTTDTQTYAIKRITTPHSYRGSVKIVAVHYDCSTPLRPTQLRHVSSSANAQKMQNNASKFDVQLNCNKHQAWYSVNTQKTTLRYRIYLMTRLLCGCVITITE